MGGGLWNGVSRQAQVFVEVDCYSAVILMMKCHAENGMSVGSVHKIGRDLEEVATAASFVGTKYSGYPTLRLDHCHLDHSH